jgi:hypothetical protein
LTESLAKGKAKGHVFNNKQDSNLLSTNINNSRFDFFFSSLCSLECESPYVSSSQLACECSLSEVPDSPLYEFVRRHCWNSSEIHDKNIRRVEWMTSHPLQNAFSLNWLRLMAAVKLANKNRKKVRKMNEFCLEIW